MHATQSNELFPVACASAVTEALAAAGEDGAEGGEARGESLLLPLLQGLLGSGGERLLAGLGAAGADVVADVRRSLGRLRAALAPPADHPQARALLSLADRLEDALDAADRLDGCRRRPRRRRTARHTVGVTHEELEEARRLVDRDQLSLSSVRDPHTPSSGPASSVSGANSVEEPPTPERKQSIDEGEMAYHNAVASHQKIIPLAHSASFASAPAVVHESRVVERRAAAPKKPDFFRHSVADGAQPPREERRPSKSGIAAIANKFDSQAREAAPTYQARRAPIVRSPPPPVKSTPVQPPKQIVREEPKRTVPLYKPLPPTYNFAALQSQDEISKPLNRFNNNKRLRMKRANTIDIGRPLGGYKVDSDTDEENARRGPIVPEFRPQTENDRKFVAFMRKNQENEQVTVNGQTNWSNRFGNIKNAFESRERDDHSRSSSASSAKRFWRTAEETPSIQKPRKFLNDVSNSNIVKPPWAAEKREPPRVHIPPPQPQAPPPAAAAPPATQAPHAPHTPHASHIPHASLPPLKISNQPPPIPQSPTRPIAAKQFVAKPIPVNQFSHAPMSAFKPPAKILSPTSAASYVWSPPSLNNTASPTADTPPTYPITPKAIIPSPPVPSVPWAAPDHDKPRRVLGVAAAKFENAKYEAPPPPTAPPYRERTFPVNPPTPPTHAPPHAQNYPVKAIPSQNNLAAPELVKKIDSGKPNASSIPFPPKVDAQRLQIEFYEKQIRDRHRVEPMTNGHREPAERKSSAPPAYTVTDFTPNNTMSTFVPLQQTPDIEKARAHKIDYLPDVVMNENERNDYSRSPRPQGSPYSPQTKVYQNGNGIYANGADEGLTTEHGSVETKVMRGPVRGAATITAGVRTRHDERGAADSLKGVLDKLSFPKREATATHRKKDGPRSQVRAPVQNGPSPLPAPAPHARPPAEPELPHSPAGGRSPALAASRESVLSSESASAGSSPLSRSGSWHQLERTPPAPSPRRVVGRTKSMHLLAVPKLYEGGIARGELSEKKKTVEAYFGGQPSAARAPPAARRSQAQGYALGRSRTMPTVAELQLLDESNADDAFEDLVSALA